MEQSLLQILQNKDVLSVILILALSFFLLVLAKFVGEILKTKQDDDSENSELSEIKNLLTNHITEIEKKLDKHEEILWDLVNRVAKLEAKINNVRTR